MTERALQGALRISWPRCLRAANGKWNSLSSQGYPTVIIRSTLEPKRGLGEKGFLKIPVLF